MDSDTLYSIGELSRRTGLTVKTIRFYSDRGIVPPTDRSPAGYRLYGPDALARLDLVRTLRELGARLGHGASGWRMLRSGANRVVCLRVLIEGAQTAWHRPCFASAGVWVYGASGSEPCGCRVSRVPAVPTSCGRRPARRGGASMFFVKRVGSVGPGFDLLRGA